MNYYIFIFSMCEDFVHVVAMISHVKSAVLEVNNPLLINNYTITSIEVLV